MFVKGLNHLGTACPSLKHLKVEGSAMVLRSVPPGRPLELESLSLAGSNWSGCRVPFFVGPQLMQLDLSNTDIEDGDLRSVVGCAAPCQVSGMELLTVALLFSKC